MTKIIVYFPLRMCYNRAKHPSEVEVIFVRRRSTVFAGRTWLDLGEFTGDADMMVLVGRVQSPEDLTDVAGLAGTGRDTSTIPMQNQKQMRLPKTF